MLSLSLFLSAANLAAQQKPTPASSSAENTAGVMAKSVSASLSHEAEAEKSSAQARPQASPSTEPRAEPATCPPAKACPDCQPSPTLDSAQLATIQMLTGVVTTAIALPATLAIAGTMGQGPSDLYLAGLPALFVLALLPPIATASSQWAMSKWLVGEQAGSLWWSLGAAGLSHVAAIAGAVALRVSTHDLAATTSYVAAESLLMPSVVTATLSLTAADEQAEKQELAQ